MSARRGVFTQRTTLFRRQDPGLQRWTCFACQRARYSGRTDQSRHSGPFGRRLRVALRDTKIQWKPIPVGLGIGFLGAFQFYRVRQAEKRQQQEEKDALDPDDIDTSGGEDATRPKKRERIRPSGPWYIDRRHTSRPTD